MADEPVTPPSTEPVAAVPPEPTPPPAPVEPEWNARENFQRLENLIMTMASQMRPSTPEPKNSGEMSDEELWSLAQQGNRQAFELYQERIADRRFDKRFGQERNSQSVQAQVAALVTKYPEFSDPNHPLTQRARAFKQAQVQLGDPANSMKTDLDAMLRAVADSRDIIQPKPAVAPSRAPAPGHIAPSHQRVAGTPREEAVTDTDMKLARQYGSKDPAGAKKRFAERQNNGMSSVSPTVIAALDVAERQGNVR